MIQIKTPSSGIYYVVRYKDNLGGVFAVAARVSYSKEIKMKTIEMKLASVPVKEVIERFTAYDIKLSCPLVEKKQPIT
ncbi:hypothetical protein [Paenibacillus guangzhouensis]|uniref:hypothetical protein n=1 Tax=Paenibacillus guangzhouensis TaxID=1473112 RepID=UPI001266D97C|nr:hypothetical protein [Paenibacillus guangzhouensis]